MKDKIIKLGFSSVEVDELLKISKNIEKDYETLKKGYPIQYLIGYVNFYGYKIKVNENVLIPRYETEYLIEKTIKYAKELFNSKIDILDLGTGSGCIAITLAKELDCNVTGIDISNEALELAKLNSIDNNTNIKFINNNMLDNINDKYDLIISNPPYISKNETIMEMVEKYDIDYIKNISFINDVKIILLTVKKVFIREGIGQGEQHPGNLYDVRANWLDENGKIKPEYQDDSPV